MSIPNLKPGLSWEKFKSNKIPKNAIVGGRKVNGDPIYIGIILYNRENVPGAIYSTKGTFNIHIPYGCTTYTINKNFYILCAEEDVELQWMEANYGRITNGAISVDKNHDISIGRVKYCGEMIVGKVHSSHKCLYIPYNKSEIHFSEYEVLNVS